MNQRGCILNRPGLEMRRSPDFYKKLDFHVTSVLCMPIVLEDRTQGAFLALNKIGAESHFSHFDMYCLGIIANNAAVAFRCSGCELSTPPGGPKLSQALIGTDIGIEAAVRGLINEAYAALKADKISLFLHRNPSHLVCLVSPDIKGTEIPTDAGFVGLTFKHSQPVKVSNAKTDHRHYSAVDEKENYHTGSLLSFPVMGANGCPLGVLQALNKAGGGDFTPADERYMADLCNKVGHLITRIEMAGSELKCHQIISSLGKFSECVSGLATSPRSVLNDILREAMVHCMDIADCQEVQFFSLNTEALGVTSQHANVSSSSVECAELGGIEGEFLVLKSVSVQSHTVGHASPDKPDVVPTAKYSNGHAAVVVEEGPEVNVDSEGVHPAILEAMQKKCIIELALDDARGEAFLPGLDAATALIVPLSTAASAVPSSTVFHNPVDVMVLARRRTADMSPDTCVLPFLSVEKDGLKSFAHVLVSGIRTLALFREQVHMQTVLTNDSSLMKSTLNSWKIAFFVVSSENYSVIVHNRLTEMLLGVKRPSLSSVPLPTLLDDMCPVFMSDIRESMRTGIPKEQRGHLLKTPGFPDGVLVDYSVQEDLVDYKNNGSMVSPRARSDGGSGAPPAHKCRVSVRVLEEEHGVCGDDSVHSVYHLSKDVSARTTNSTQMLSSVVSPPKANELGLSLRAFDADDSRELEKLFDWDFNVLKMKSHDALRLAVISLFEKEICLAELNISRSQLYSYICEVDKTYRLNPFHNFYHAVSVTHFIYLLMRETRARTILRNDLLYFSMLLSAIVHDVDHPGNTNLFEVHSRSELALLYNDTAVLENHHCSTAFKLMNQAGLDIFQHLSFQDRKECRKMTVSCILATDMDMHVTLAETMASKADGQWHIESPADKIFYGKYILHCADLSNPVRPFYLAKEWACRVSEEFNRQGEIEKARGLPVSTFLLTPDTTRLAKNEIYFSGQVVAPMWRNLAAVFPSIDHLVCQIEENVQSWKDLLENLD